MFISISESSHFMDRYRSVTHSQRRFTLIFFLFFFQPMYFKIQKHLHHSPGDLISFIKQKGFEIN